jgi:non-heme chloroperoxidase
MTSRRTFISIAASVPALAAAATVSAKDQGAAAVRVSGRLRLKDSTELFVKDWGKGRPVILTHAWPLSSDCWDQQALALVAAGYRVIAYDRRGFGRSSQPGSGYTYDQFADDLAEVIAATGAKDAALIGFSMGGGEIARYMSRHAGRNVAQVGLVATVVPGLARNRNNPDGVDPTFFDNLKDNLRKDRLMFLASLLKDVFYDTKTQPVSQHVLDWSLQMAMQAGLLALVESVDAFGKEDFVPDLATIRVPALIIHGNADTPVPFKLTARRAAAALPNAKLIEYDGVTHGLLVTERERVTRDLLAFLAT